ncbi:MAG: acyl-[acyl-carrier-protein] thioesterase [Lachnospiraceae bacterium]
MYCFECKVRYSDIGADKNMTIEAVMNAFQDCCIFHSESIGIGLTYLEESGRAWILSTWQIELIRNPALGEELKVWTWPYGFKGFYGYRNFLMEDSEGKVVARANSTWVFLDTKRMRPVRIMDDFGSRYGLAPALEMQCDSRRIEVPQDMSEQDRLTVHRFQIDTNQHVNNEKYVQMAQEVLPWGFQVKSLRVEYRKAAVLSDLIVIKSCICENRVVVTLEDTEQRPYAVVEFMEE